MEHTKGEFKTLLNAGLVLLKNSEYKYTPKKKIMFNKDIESIFESHSKAIKKITGN